MDLKLILESGDFSDDKLKDKLTKVHPKQIINQIGIIYITFFEVKYQYTTIRGNLKEGNKIFIFDSPNPERDMNKELKDYISDYNIKNPNRPLLNVKFLESSCLGYANI